MNSAFAAAAGIRHQNKHATSSSCATELQSDTVQYLIEYSTIQNYY